MWNSRLQDLYAIPCLLFFIGVVAAGGCRGKEKGGKQPATHGPSKKNPSGQPAKQIAPVVILELAKARTQVAMEAKQGGILKVHLETEPPHLIPIWDAVQSVHRVATGLIYETLLECPQDDYRPGLAEAWSVSEDRLRTTLRLRPGIKFHDQRSLTAIDVQATLEYLQRSSRRWSPFHALLADLEGVDVMPDREVRIRLVRPSDLTLRALCEIPIFPAEPLRAGGSALNQLMRNPVGTGPFRLAAWERGKRIRLIRARMDAPAAGPYLDEIVFEIDSDLARALLRTRRGEIDVLPRLLESHYPEQVSPAALRGMLDVYKLAPDRYSYIVLNLRQGALANTKFREALSLLWDRKRFAVDLHRDLADPIAAPPFGMASPDPFIASTATRLFEEAGFRDTDSDGVRDVGGEALRFTFLVPAGSRTLAAEARAYALELRRAGILLDITAMESGALLGKVQAGDFDMAPLLWDGRRDEDPRLLLSPQGDYQYTGYQPAEFVNLMERLRLATSPAERRPLFQKVADLLAKDRPVLYLYRHFALALMHRKVRGVTASGDRLDLRYAWIDP